MQSPPPNFFPITPRGLLGASEHRDRAGLLTVSSQEDGYSVGE